MKKYTVNDIRNLRPCYDPATIVSGDWAGTLIDILNAKISIPDRIWVVTKLMPAREARLFAVGCARRALLRQSDPDLCGLLVCEIAERYANETEDAETLAAADWAASEASEAAWKAAWAARAAARAAAWKAAWAARAAARAAAADWAASEASEAAWAAARAAGREARAAAWKAAWAARAAADWAASEAAWAARAAAREAAERDQQIIDLKKIAKLTE